MTEGRDTKKDLVVGGAALILAAVTAPGAVAAAAGTLAAVGWNRVAANSQRRAERLLKEMIEGDAESASFAESIQHRLESDNEETLAAFRALLSSAVQAITLDALGPMAYVGREYFRGACALPLARSALDLLNHVSALDLSNLRQLVCELATLNAATITVLADASGRSDGKKDWRAWPNGQQGDPVAIDVTPFEGSRHLFGLLKRAGLGTDSGGYGIGGSPKAIEFERPTVTFLNAVLEGTNDDKVSGT